MRDKEAEVFINLKYPGLPVDGFRYADDMYKWFSELKLHRYFLLKYEYGWLYEGDIAYHLVNKYGHTYDTPQYIEELKTDLYHFHNDMLIQRLLGYEKRRYD